MVDRSALLSSVLTVGSWALRSGGWTRQRNCLQTLEDLTEAGSIPEPRSEGRSLTSEVLLSGS